jgi:hypothetical protein
MILGIKLSTGEDIIGDTIIQGGVATISKPFQVGMVPAGPDKIGIGLMPYLQFAKKHELKVRMENVVFEFEPADALADQYRQITSGIVIACPNIEVASETPSRPNLRIER